MNKQTRISRRRWLGSSAMASIGWGAGASGWLPQIARAAGAASSQGRHCVLLWMSGGPSQIDTFDMKPDHGNGGTIKEVSTSVPGVRFSEHLPRLARQADQLAILRGLSTKEGDHLRGTTLMRTGFMAGAPVRYPAIGCSLSKRLDELSGSELKLPRYVTIAPGPFAASSTHPGFLGPKYAATSVTAAQPNDGGFAQLRVDHLDLPPGVDAQAHDKRLHLLDSMERSFRQTRATENVLAHEAVYQAAIEMVGSDAKDAFDLSTEPDRVRSRYGPSRFGQGCLMARRLIERGVPLVEVSLGDGVGWDTHADNFAQVQRLSDQLDSGWASLMEDLRDRDLLDRTTILWAGEFGRTPTINANGGRDHFPRAFSCVLAGGGVAGGQTYGRTSDDAMEVVDGKMNQQDLLATLCGALGVNPLDENMAGGGRPIAIAEGNVIEQVIQS